jgi:hypothetical protein
MRRRCSVVARGSTARAGNSPHDGTTHWGPSGLDDQVDERVARQRATEADQGVDEREDPRREDDGDRLVEVLVLDRRLDGRLRVGVRVAGEQLAQPRLAP